jgi:hypothetical protein
MRCEHWTEVTESEIIEPLISETFRSQAAQLCYSIIGNPLPTLWVESVQGELSRLSILCFTGHNIARPEVVLYGTC